MNPIAMPDPSERQGSLLRAALFFNAGFSLISGIVILLAPEAVAAWLGIESTFILSAIGSGLLLFALALFHLASRPRIDPFWALAASAADLGWVCASGILLIAWPHWFSFPGKLILAGVALAVGGFGALQLAGICRIFRLPASDRYRHCMRFEVPENAGKMWQKIGDLGAISDYAPFLKQSRLATGCEPGVGAVRTCTNLRDQTWSEECTVYVPDREFAVRFLTEAPGFPFPVEAMDGGWRIRPVGEKCEVEVWWELAPKGPLPGVLLLPMLARQAEKTIGPTIQGMVGDDPDEPGNTMAARSIRRIPSLC